jgi:hypothetical protein
VHSRQGGGRNKSARKKESSRKKESRKTERKKDKKTNREEKMTFIESLPTELSRRNYPKKK